MEFLMKAVWFSEPVMSGLSFPRTNRSSSTGHQDCISHTVMLPYLAGLSVGIQRPDWGPWPEKNKIGEYWKFKVSWFQNYINYCLKPSKAFYFKVWSVNQILPFWKLVPVLRWPTDILQRKKFYSLLLRCLSALQLLDSCVDVSSFLQIDRGTSPGSWQLRHCIVDNLLWQVPSEACVEQDQAAGVHH